MTRGKDHMKASGKSGVIFVPYVVSVPFYQTETKLNEL